MAISLKAERRAFLWKAKTRTLPAEALKPTSLDELICILEGEHSAGRARVYLDAENRILDDSIPPPNLKNQIYIADIKRHPTRDVVSILLNRGDPQSVDPALLDPSANAVRVERPTAKEAPGWSAHLVISTKTTGGVHRACYEQMSRMPSSLVLATFDRIVERALVGNPAYTYQVIKKGKKPKIEHRPYRPLLEVKRSPSETLQEDLNHGRLSGITLTREKPIDAGLAVDSRVKRIEEQVLITLAKLDADEAREYLAKVLPAARRDYSSVQVHIVDLPGKQSSNPTIPLQQEAAMEELYVRAKRMTGFSVLLEQCYDSVCTDIEDAMIDLIEDDDNWS